MAFSLMEIIKIQTMVFLKIKQLDSTRMIMWINITVESVLSVRQSDSLALFCTLITLI